MKELLSTIKTVFFLIVGVGKKKDLEKIFNNIENKGPWLYILFGLLAVAIFVASIILVVNIVLP